MSPRLGEQRRSARLGRRSSGRSIARPSAPIAGESGAKLGKQLIEKRVLTKYPDQRVGIFVDVSNMYWSVRRLGGSLNFRALREAAVGERKLIRALAYAVTSGLPEEEKFFSALTKS
ncbi:MAG: NYN domain-containing protein, partial [Candidatus Andersenbacteria bacterium]